MKIQQSHTLGYGSSICEGLWSQKLLLLQVAGKRPQFARLRYEKEIFVAK
jgi:hypothetical protein